MLIDWNAFEWYDTTMKEISIVKMTVTLYTELIVAQYSSVLYGWQTSKKSMSPVTFNYRTYFFFAVTLYLLLRFPQ